MCYGKYKNGIEKWKHTRLIIAWQAGKRPYQVVQLPGDFEHLENINPTPEEMKKRMQRLRNVKGFEDKWQKYQK